MWRAHPPAAGMTTRIEERRNARAVIGGTLAKEL
jgi:hypothetical protein